ncbi:MAG: AraC family transcriptional regulator [Planctomycetota bacterium]|jgi:AraC-like DNA-binding protein|nr:AraC family transcriptional regulator [Planctomycetota bacterium]
MLKVGAAVALKPMSGPIDIAAASFIERDPDYTTDPHRRDDFQWYHVVYGEIEQRYDDAVLRLEAGCGVVYPPGVLRGPRAVAAADGARVRPPGYFWVTFRNPGLELSSLYAKVLRVSAALDPDIAALIATLREVDIPQREFLREALVVRLLLGLVQIQGGGHEPQRPALNRSAEVHQVTAALAFMQRHLDQMITRDEIAAAAHCSPAHLARLFRREQGASVGTVLTNLRVERAKGLLLSTQQSIAQIAGAVGFASYNHFSHVFRRAVGIAPSAYRRARGQSWR